jgi:hypothetical protein
MNMIATAAIAVSAGVLLSAGCGSGSASPDDAVRPAPAGAASNSRISTPVSINAQMVSIVDHAAHGLWDAEREDKAPRTQADWESIAEHAIQMAAAGALIVLPASGTNDLALTQEPEWSKWARAMSDAGLAAFTASQDQNLAGLVAANSRLVESCESCHQRYKPSLPSEGIMHQHMHVEKPDPGRR